MNLRNSIHRYGSLSIAAHWLMLILLIAVYACMELRGYFPKGSALREGLKTWHYMLGLAVLALVVLRLILRGFGPQPSIHPQPPRWQVLSAKLMHLALYAFMFVMPILGWLILSAEGQPIPFFGLQLPALASASASVADWAGQAHELIADAGYFLVGLHAVAALYHHYILRDDTLKRMLPSAH
jgi:cytochrome b561